MAFFSHFSKSAVLTSLFIAFGHKFKTFSKLYAQPLDSPSPKPLAEDIVSFGPQLCRASIHSPIPPEDDPLHRYFLRRSYYMKNLGCVYEYDHNEPVLARGGADPTMRISPVDEDKVKPMPYLNKTCYCIELDEKKEIQPTYQQFPQKKHSKSKAPAPIRFPAASYKTPYIESEEEVKEWEEYQQMKEELIAHMKKEDRGKQKTPAHSRPEVDLEWPNYSSGGPVFPYPIFPRRNILEYDDFIICYDHQTKLACWTLEAVDVSDVDEMRWAPHDDTRDPEVPKEFCAQEKDYADVDNLFRKYHLADIDFHVNPRTKDCKDACVFTNVVPQAVDCVDPFSTSLWDKLFEYIAELKLLHSQIYILTGPLYLPRKRVDGKKFVRCHVVGESKILVPTHFFKVILTQHWEDHEKYILQCYLFKNKAVQSSLKLKDYLIDRHLLEKELGFQIFPLVADKCITKKLPFPPEYQDFNEKYF